MINRLKQRMHQDEGFTLIELLIVIVVLGILAAIVVFALSNQTSNSAVSACKADAKAVEIAQEAYRAQSPVTAGPNNFAPDINTLRGLQPDGITPIPGAQAYLRSAPSTDHYVIVTHIDGKVYVFPQGTALNAAADPAADFDVHPERCGTGAGGVVS